MTEKKTKLHPVLRANADKLKRGEPLYDSNQPPAPVPAAPKRPTIRSKKPVGRS